ncbi:unnamed protein product, partial [Porites lobata]
SGNLSLLQVLKKHLIDSNYDKGTPPYFKVNSTLIDLDVYIDTFGKVEEVNMEIGAYVYFRQQWTDPRIANVINSTVWMKGEDIMMLWKPDTACYNSRGETNLDKEDKHIHSVMKLFPNGTVYYSRNTHLVAACDMNLRNFPIDTQNCTFTFGSYGFPNDAVDYRWHRNGVFIARHTMAQFTVIASQVSSRVLKFDVGLFTLLDMSFLLQRSLGYYLIQLYLPCIFLVMLSWLVFWMSPESGGDRLTVGITCILTIVFLLGYVNGMLPKVSYVKGVDWYLITSFLFIFLSLVECVVVEKLESSASKERASKESGQENEDLSASQQPSKEKQEQPTLHGNVSEIFCRKDGSSKISDGSRVKPKRVQVLPVASETPAFNHYEKGWLSQIKSKFLPVSEKRKAKPLSRAQKIDMASRILFPFLYVVYNTVYWCVYLNGVEILA